MRTRSLLLRASVLVLSVLVAGCTSSLPMPTGTAPGGSVTSAGPVTPGFTPSPGETLNADQKRLMNWAQQQTGWASIESYTTLMPIGDVLRPDDKPRLYLVILRAHQPVSVDRLKEIARTLEAERSGVPLGVHILSGDDVYGLVNNAAPNSRTYADLAKFKAMPGVRKLTVGAAGDWVSLQVTADRPTLTRVLDDAVAQRYGVCLFDEATMDYCGSENVLKNEEELLRAVLPDPAVGLRQRPTIPSQLSAELQVAKPADLPKTTPLMSAHSRKLSTSIRVGRLLMVSAADDPTSPQMAVGFELAENPAATSASLGKGASVIVHVKGDEGKAAIQPLVDKAASQYPNVQVTIVVD